MNLYLSVHCAVQTLVGGSTDSRRKPYLHGPAPVVACCRSGSVVSAVRHGEMVSPHMASHGVLAVTRRGAPAPENEIRHYPVYSEVVTEGKGARPTQTDQRRDSEGGKRSDLLEAG